MKYSVLKLNLRFRVSWFLTSLVSYISGFGSLEVMHFSIFNHYFE